MDSTPRNETKECVDIFARHQSTRLGNDIMTIFIQTLIIMTLLGITYNGIYLTDFIYLRLYL